MSKSRRSTTKQHAAPSPHVPAPAQNRPARSVCVYCGSGKGVNPVYAAAARCLGAALAGHGMGLVFGGSGNGLMGETARAVLAHGGYVTGVIPQNLVGIEAPFTEAQDLHYVSTLHERKMLMFEKSDAFVALPGGLGTLEELVEQLTWVQLGHHNKPVVIADIAGYWQPLIKMFEAMHTETFIRPGLDARYLTVPHAEDIVPAIESALGAPALTG